MSFNMAEETAKIIHQKRLERLKCAYNSGVKIAFGTDIMVAIDGETRGEVAIDYITSFVEAGIPNDAILKIMTINAYELLGLKYKRGLLKPKHFADFIATDDNPLTNIDALRKVVFVMKNGKVEKGL